MMWFDKSNGDALFCDRRQLPHGSIPQQPSFSVNPDQVCDFTDLPFEDETFYLVVFDPPHLAISESSIWRIRNRYLGIRQQRVGKRSG